MHMHMTHDTCTRCTCTHLGEQFLLGPLAKVDLDVHEIEVFERAEQVVHHRREDRAVARVVDRLVAQLDPRRVVRHVTVLD